ncbi:MAG: response regulator [Spirochaetaceae bacterium]|nr:MAG: response regulator [Spirochaetaceae bacterium]
MKGIQTRVLYIDDSAFDRELVRDALTHYRSEGAPDRPVYALTEAASQTEFQAHLEHEPPDIVLTDFNILGFDGLEVLDSVRARWADVPVILVTGTGSEEVAVAAMKSGAADYIIKSPRAIERLPLAIEAVLGARRDAAARAVAEHSLADSEARFRRAVEEAPVPIVIHADDGEIIAISRAWTEISGYDRASIPTMHDWLDRAYPSERELAEREIEQSFDAPSAHHVGEYTIQCADGSERVWDFSCTPLGSLPDGRRCAIRIANDLTERRRLDRQLQLSQKMEAIGRLAGGVAHDFNNMLQVIIGYAALGAEEFADRDELPVWLRMITEATRRSANLTRQLLAFASSQPAAPRRVALPAAIGEMTRLLDRLIGEQIELVVRCDESTWPVLIDPTGLDAIIANLVINARDAIPGSGSITIATQNRRVPRSLAERFSVAPGDYAVMTVRDTGKGIDRRALERIWEPFFTTKHRGVGTGLGLPTVYRTVTGAGGFAEIDTAAGKGTEFSVYLPRSNREIVSAGPAGSTDFHATGVALLIEDEESVRRVGEELLHRVGYHVIATGDPMHAIDLVRDGLPDLAVVVTDAVLPAIRGVEVIARLRELVPGLPAVLTSGYTVDDQNASDAGSVDMASLPKPFDQAALIAALAAASAGHTL